MDHDLPIPSPIQPLSPDQMARKAESEAFVTEYRELCKKHGREWKPGIKVNEPFGIFPILLLTDYHEPKDGKKTSAGS